MKKVSIIIPIYNTEKYLRQCLNSAINQTMKDIEILCVNDGSTDTSLQIIEQISKKDKRIKIINKKNTGYGHTMNIGIESSEGKYLIFLESDDYILPDMCEVLYEFCENHNLEMIKTDFYEFISSNSKEYSRYKKVSDYGNYHKVLTPRNNSEVFYASMYTWTCMYKREFINKHNIRHHETSGASYQDNGFWFQTLMYCERMYLLDRAFYMYRQDNPLSSIHSKKNVNTFSKEYDFIREKIDEYPDLSYKRRFLNICAFFNLHHNMISLLRVDKQYTEELLQIINKDFGKYMEKQAWNIKELSTEFFEAIDVMLSSATNIKEEIWEFIDKDIVRKEILNQYNVLVLYGAGVYANKILCEFEKNKIWNKNIYCGVTQDKEIGRKIGEIEIQSIQELLHEEKNALVIVCARKGSVNEGQMCDNLNQWGVENYIHANELIVDDIWE